MIIWNYILQFISRTWRKQYKKESRQIQDLMKKIINEYQQDQKEWESSERKERWDEYRKKLSEIKSEGEKGDIFKIRHLLESQILYEIYQDPPISHRMVDYYNSQIEEIYRKRTERKQFLLIIIGVIFTIFSGIGAIFTILQYFKP